MSRKLGGVSRVTDEEGNNVGIELRFGDLAVTSKQPRGTRVRMTHKGGLIEVKAKKGDLRGTRKYRNLVNGHNWRGFIITGADKKCHNGNYLVTKWGEIKKVNFKTSKKTGRTALKDKKVGQYNAFYPDDGTLLQGE